MTEISIKFEYDHKSYEIKFITKTMLRNYPGIGKCWPKITQCVIYRDRMIVGLGTVTKHDKDKDNPRYARAYAAKQAINNGNLRHWNELRKLMWNKINQLSYDTISN